MPTLTVPIPVPGPSYSQAREKLVRAIPPKVLCMLACGGVGCRYEGPGCWRANQQAILGLYSSWVTDDIVAMARPSTHLIKKYNIIEQFRRLNVRSVLNMQYPGEHAHCGPPLDPGSGFSYSPQTFMESDIYFYNFGMPDYAACSLVGMIDGVKVLTYAVEEGRVAVHCHAGLGRTGVLIACYLVYTLRISPSEAVHYVRIKRPRSIQTRTQINLVFDFARLLGTQLAQYPDLSLRHGAPVTLQHHLNRQALLLHGQEARALRHTPKAVYLLCVCLSCLALGRPAPREVRVELERTSALRSLGRAVRETLVARRYLPLPREGHRGSGARSGSVTSWDEPLGFLERKRDVLLDRRSYSDSDLNKITVNQDRELGQYCTPVSGNSRDRCGQDLLKADTRLVRPIPATPSADQHTSREDTCKLQSPAGATTVNKNCVTRPKCTAKKTRPLTKFCSISEMHKNQHRSAPSTVALAVSRAMADHEPPGEIILQRTRLLQEELNSSECGWALLVTESDPQVLSFLLWTWLEKLKEPVLSTEDSDRLASGANHQSPLSVLKKPQHHTIVCLLSCVAAVTSVCPHREDAVLRRLIRALTRRPQEEIVNHATLMKTLKNLQRNSSPQPLTTASEDSKQR